MIGVGAIEPLQRPRPHLLERDEALIAEHPRAAHATAARAFGTTRRWAIGAARGRAHGHAAMATGAIGSASAFGAMRRGKFLAADIAVTIGVDPIEHPRAHLVAAMLACHPHLVRRDPAVMIGIEPGEHMVGALDHLLAGEIAFRPAPLGARSTLGDGDAGARKQGRAGEEGQCLHRNFLHVHGKGDDRLLPGRCRSILSGRNKLVPNCLSRLALARRSGLRVRRIQLIQCYATLEGPSMARLMKLLMIVTLVVANGSAAAGAICHHRDAREHASARLSQNAKVAAAALTEEAAAAAASKNGDVGGSSSLSLPAHILPRASFAPVPDSVEPMHKWHMDSAPLANRSIRPLLEPPVA
jgi:hypothetical protein